MISTRGRYALRVLVDLAEHDDGKYVPIKDVVARQELPPKYLEHILAILTENQFIVGLRGRGGGYRLNRRAEEFTVGDVLRLTEESLAPVSCLNCGVTPCKRAAECRTLNMWTEFFDITNKYFDGITVADLMKSPQTLQ